MSIAERIEQRLRDQLPVVELVLENESHMHRRGQDSHFKLVLVSPAFAGQSLVKRHQTVYGVLQEEMQQLHALALHTFTPEEWAARDEGAADSPRCRGGNGL